MQIGIGNDFGLPLTLLEKSRVYPLADPCIKAYAKKQPTSRRVHVDAFGYSSIHFVRR
jgi:hypothetical protein